ncbi:hemagglutinin-related protein [Pandoraea bronchicola]|uniref:Hemagglutinin-related protein n=2 Tax=Pandoraea bronchicola TaxID=2508287 RepID=A0A5E5BWT8_9BURK|nr:hemagglutinin-related protein [Pandoraea bronchicola]
MLTTFLIILNYTAPQRLNATSVGQTGKAVGKVSAPRKKALGVAIGRLTVAPMLGVIENTNEAAQHERTGQTAEETIAAANRDVSSDKDGSGALANKFDKEQIETRFEIMQTLQREVGTFVGNRAREYEALKATRKNKTAPVKLTELDRPLGDAAKWHPAADASNVSVVRVQPAFPASPPPTSSAIDRHSSVNQ